MKSSDITNPGNTKIIFTKDGVEQNESNLEQLGITWACDFAKATTAEPDLTINTTSETPAGEYTFKLENDGFETLPVSFWVKPISIELTADNWKDEGTYYWTGEEQHPEVVLEDEEYKDIITFKYTYGDYLSDPSNGKDVGWHTVNVSSVNPNYKLTRKTSWYYQIKKRPATVTTEPTAITGLKYTGEDQKLITKGDSAAGTVEYKIGSMGTATTDIPKACNAGTYEIYYRVQPTDTDHYDTSSWIKLDTSVSIEKIPFTFECITAEDKVYDGSNYIPLNINNIIFKTGEKIISRNEILTFEIRGYVDENDVNVGNDKKVTFNYISWSSTNYELDKDHSQQETTVNITPAPVTLKWQNNTSLNYTGKEQTVTATPYGKGSEWPIKDNFNITYNNNTATKVGNYHAKVTDLGNSNYMISDEDNGCDWKIQYLSTSSDITVNGMPVTDNWYTSENVTLQAPTNYYISIDNEQNWAPSYTYAEQGENTITYQLKNIDIDAITEPRTITLKLDSEAPTGEIKIRNKVLNKLLDTITFGHWYQDTTDFKIEATDATSGIAKVEYWIAESDKQLIDANWVEGTKGTITDKGKRLIYARLTDNAGNVSVINSDGLVVYQNATADTTAVTYKRLSNETKDITVKLNGNAIKAVQIADGIELAAEQYLINDNKITLTAAYLETLTVGDHKYTVSYSPCGTTDPYIDGDEPATTTFTVSVVRRTVDAEISDVSKTYDGAPVESPNITTESKGAQTITWWDAQGNVFDSAPKNAGTYTVKLTVAATDDYNAITTEKGFTISKAEASVTAESKTVTYTGDAADYTATVELVNNENFDGSIHYSYRTNGTEDSYTEGLPVNAGTYEVKASIDAMQNYEAAKATAILTINRKPMNKAEVLFKDQLVYNGMEQTQEIASVRLDGRDVTYEVTGNKGTKVGFYYLILTGTGNYTGRLTIEFYIEPKDISEAVIALDNDTFIYEIGKTQRPQITSVTVDERSLAETKDYTVEIPTDSEIVGIYTITLTGKGNYKGQAEVQYKIQKKSANPVISGVPETVTYGDDSFQLATDYIGSGALTYHVDDEKVLTVDSQGKVTVKNAGTAVITAVVAETENYAESQAAVIVQVQKKALTFDTSEVKVLDKLYDHNTSAVTVGDVRVSGMLKGDDAGFQYDGLTAVYESDAVGTEKVVTVTIENPTIANGNYALPKELTFKVIGAILAAEQNSQAVSVSGEKKEYSLVIGKNEKLELTPELLANEKLNTEEKIKNTLFTALGEKQSESEGKVVYDLVLLVTADHGVTWQRVTAEDFPAEGIEVILAYPEGTNAKEYEFTAVHMFTSAGKAGQMEFPKVEKKEDGLHIVLTGLSPVALSWSKAEVKNPVKNNGKHNHKSSSTEPEVTETVAGSVQTSVSSAHTGDTTQTWPLIAMMLIALGGIGAVVYRKRKHL